METAPDPGQVILDRITALEVERAKIEAQVSVEMLAFADHARAEADAISDPRRRQIQVAYAADQLAAVVHQPAKIVQDRLAQARRVRGLLPQTWLAHLAGRIDAYRISLIASTAHKVADNNHNLIHLDATIGDYAATHTTAQLRGKLNRFVATYGTRREAVRAERAKRGVWLSHQADGMSYLTAYLSTADAIRIHAELTAKAKAVSDDRTLEQRTADEFVAQMRGIVAGQSISSRAVIGITIPCTSLAGYTHEAGEAWDGSYALPAEMVRQLALEPGTLFHRVITDPLGRILDITELGRFPSAKLRIGVDIRDGTCQVAACNMPAIDCDIDHDIPHPRGPTAGSNLRDLCRRHHNIKSAQVADPTTLQMSSHPTSELQHDLASYAVAWSYAS